MPLVNSKYILATRSGVSSKPSLSGSSPIASDILAHGLADLALSNVRVVVPSLSSMAKQSLAGATVAVSAVKSSARLLQMFSCVASVSVIKITPICVQTVNLEQNILS